MFKLICKLVAKQLFRTVPDKVTISPLILRALSNLKNYNLFPFDFTPLSFESLNKKINSKSNKLIFEKLHHRIAQILKENKIASCICKISTALQFH